jgi:hypothetical protein
MDPARKLLWFIRDGKTSFLIAIENEARLLGETVRFRDECVEVLEDRTYANWTVERYLKARN